MHVLFLTPANFLVLFYNQWFLVREKFGFDIELSKPCVFEDNGIAAVLHEQDSSGTRHLIAVPSTGRFPYEQFMDLAAEDVMVDDSSHKGATPGNVSDDETDDNGGHGNDLVRPLTFVREPCFSVPCASDIYQFVLLPTMLA
jgi:hypothetical protein